MLVPGLVAATVMFAACAVLASDSPPGRAVLYAVQQWRRQRRRHR